MDQLRAVGKAIKNSPRAIRKKFGHSSDHEQLQEDWYHSEDPVNAGVTFYVKYLGSTSVTRTHGTGSTDEAVRTIVQDAKKRGGKLQKVMVTVSSKYIRLVDIQLQMKLDEIPLYRVSYCTVDPYYDKVFCYISRNSETKALECHAFLCSKKSKAEAITLTVAQAFNIAFEKWQNAKKQKAAQQKALKEAQRLAQAEEAGKLVTANGTATSGPPSNGVTSSPAKISSPAKQQSVATTATPHISPPPPSPRRQASPPTVTMQPAESNGPHQQPDIGTTLNSSPSHPSKPVLLRTESRDDSSIGKGFLAVKSTIAKAVSLDYLQLDDQFDMEFTRLAEARSNPRLPIGDHIDQTDVKDDVAGFLRGDQTPQDLSQTHSVDDLLQL